MKCQTILILLLSLLSTLAVANPVEKEDVRNNLYNYADKSINTINAFIDKLEKEKSKTNSDEIKDLLKQTIIKARDDKMRFKEVQETLSVPSTAKDPSDVAQKAKEAFKQYRSHIEQYRSHADKYNIPATLEKIKEPPCHNCMPVEGEGGVAGDRPTITKTNLPHGERLPPAERSEEKKTICIPEKEQEKSIPEQKNSSVTCPPPNVTPEKTQKSEPYI